MKWDEETKGKKKRDVIIFFIKICKYKVLNKIFTYYFNNYNLIIVLKYKINVRLISKKTLQ